MGNVTGKGETNYLYFIIGGLLVVLALFLLFSASPAGEGCVGVVKISGTLASEDVDATLFSDEVKGADTLAREIEEANKSGDVKAVLLLIDSPGGSVVASKRLYDAVSALDKPTVSYINELAASGGYYVASGTDYIVSNPDAITGSIGAKATFSDMSGLFEKIGYREMVVKSGEMKDIGSPSRQMTPDEVAVISGIVNESFAEFVADVERGRGNRLDFALFGTVLDARIMSGRQAKRIGLVDELGTKQDAVMKAAQLGGITTDSPRLCSLSGTEGKKGIFSSLSSQVASALVQGAGSWQISLK